ncbi:MAG: glycoside hydrolase family 16 protein [Terracidiphilus sp.]
MNHLPLLPHSGNRAAASVLVAVIVLTGCHLPVGSARPSIEVTKIPVSSIGGPDQMDEIAGRAPNALPSQQIVLYAHSGAWWIQPFANQPYTRIQPDSTWKNFTHMGTEYAVLLVDPGYNPALKITALPSEGNGVVAIAVVNGKAGVPAAAKVIRFSGYDWNVRAAESDHGGEPNAYDPADAWTDAKGYLHLRMQQRGGHWTCAEVSLNRSLGYGTYRFVVQDSAHLGPSAVLGFFTWDDARLEGFHNEFDIELSRWGDAKSRNAQYVVQPFYTPENFYRFTTPAGPVTYQVQWRRGAISFETFAGTSIDPKAKPISQHQFTSGLPTPASETMHMDLYDFHHAENPSQVPAEVVIEKFAFSP